MPKKEFQQVKLPNGMRLVVVPRPGTQALTALVFVTVGSRYEPERTAGISHFLEHMCFKGTVKRPSTQLIARTLDAVGAEFNAYTSKEYTGYYIKVDARHGELAVDMLSDIYYHSLFEDVEIQREKGAVCQEIHMYEDNPLMSIEDWFEQQLFPKHTLGRNIAGSVETVKALTRRDVVEWHDTFYSTDRTTIVLAGKMPKNIITLVKKYFKDARKGKKVSFEKFSVSPRTYAAPCVALKEKKVDQAQLMLGFPGLPYGHKDEAAASLLRLILGGGMSSRLFIEVRERRGLAYLVRAGASQFQEIGAFTVHAGLDVSKMKEAVQVICAEVDRMKKEPVTAKELAEAKDQWEGKITLASEDSTWQAEWYTENVFRGRMRSPQDAIVALRRVTTQDIKRVAQEIFDWSKVRVAIIGPRMNTEALEKEIKNIKA